MSSIICQGVRELTQTYTAHEPVFFLLSARLNCNIPLEKELLHIDNSISGNKFKCFSLAKEQPTQKSCFSHTSKSLNVWVWELIYIVWLTVFHVIHLLLITKRLLYRANPSWPWYLLSCLSWFLYNGFLFSLSVAPFWALGFVLSCPKGQDTLVNFHCFQLCMNKLTCWISHDSLMDLKMAILKTSLLSQQHVMMSKCHMICTNYITYITSIMASWYNLSQNRLKSNRFYST